MRQTEDLQCGGLKIMQDKDLYTFTSDSVILANFLKIKRGETAVEIGAGCGVISILACAKNPVQKICCFEVDPALALLAKDNVSLNKFEQKICVINDKIQSFCKYMPKFSADVVFSNPPYLKSADGNTTRLCARHDNLLPMQDLCKAASDLLCDGGRFYVVYDSQRSCELIACLIKHKLQPKTMFFTENGKGKIVLVVIEAVKCGKSGITVLPNLVTNNQDGRFLQKLQTRNFLN